MSTQSSEMRYAKSAQHHPLSGMASSMETESLSTAGPPEAEKKKEKKKK